MNENIICPFCSPAILNYAFLESDKFLAVYNIAPVLPGHSLIITRAHITSIMELTDNELYEFVRFSRKAIRILMSVFQTEAFNWTLQEKEEAGQTIAHMHIHIIPRKPEDLPEPGEWYPRMMNNIDNFIDSSKRPRLTQAEMKSVIERLRNAGGEMMQ
jgi:bis(5'-adenosyl)-triphosphatase